MEEQKCEVSENRKKSRARGKEQRSREKLNELEKNRNKKLNDIFLELRTLLQESSMPTKRDKINILRNTSEHILQLQQAVFNAQSWLSHQLSPKQPNLHPPIVAPTEELPTTDSIFENMFRKTNVAFLIVTVAGHIKECNAMCSQLFDMPENALRNGSFFQFILPQDLPDMYRAFALLLSSPQISVHSMKKSILFNERILICTISMWQISTTLDDPSPMIHMMIRPLPSSAVSSAVTPIPIPTSTLPSSSPSSSSLALSLTVQTPQLLP